LRAEIPHLPSGGHIRVPEPPVIAAAGFKRLGLVVAALIVAGIGALAAISFLIPAESVRLAIKAEIEAVTGLTTTINGATSVLLFPWGTVSFEDVMLGGDGGVEPPLVAERLTARLRLMPLLFGRIEAADLSLHRPRIVVSFVPSGGSNWSSLTASLARTLQAQDGGAAGLMSFSEIRISDGTLTLRDAVHGINETLSKVEMSLAWPAISKSFVATGRFGWRNEPIDASIGINDLRAAVEGDRAGLKMRLTGDPFRLAFDGHISGRPAIKMEGTLAADTVSLRRALVWAGERPVPGGGFGRFALKAQTDLAGGSVALSSVNVELDGNSAEGVLTIAADGRLAVQGTLAADELDLTPYVSTVHLLRSSEREWSRVPIVLDGLSDFDLDLRLSAAKIDLASAKLGRTAMAARLRDGHLSVTIGESQAFGGVLKGSIAVEKGQAGAHIKSQLQFADVDLENCLGDLFALRRVEGKGTLAVAVEGTGENVLALTETLAGSATLAASQGALVGLNLEQLLRRLERRPLSGGAEFRSGRTSFDKLGVSVKLADGTATIENVQLSGPGVRLALTGSVSVPTRDLDLKGTAGLVSARAPDDSAFELPFVVQGPWDDPIMLPDAESLIRRSGAAAPLLDSVRDRKTREAVRSAIERLTNGALPSSSASAPPANPAPAPQ
jgi:AsmA protein